MLGYVLRRVAVGFAMLVALSVLIFILLRLTPGDPIDAFINPNVAMTDAEMAAVRARLGLDKPLPVQYLAWAASAATGDLGYSLQRNGETVLGLIGQRIGPTLLLMGTALTLAIVVGIPLGYVAARYQGRPLDTIVVSGSLLGVATPVFFLALLLRQRKLVGL